MPSANNPFGPVVGDILLTYPCEYKSNRGTLFLASRGVCFHSTFLSFETSRLVIPWKSVREINEKEGDAAFSIVAKHNGGVIRIYDFRVLNGTARNIVLKDMRSAHHKNGKVSADANGNTNGLETVCEEKPDCEGGSSDVGISARKQLCDQVSGVSSESDLKDASDDVPGKLEKPWVRRSLSEPLAKSTVKRVKNSSQYESEEDFRAECTITAMAGFRNMSQVIKSKKESLGGDGEENELDEPLSGPEGTGTIEPMDMRQAWKEARDSTNPSFKEVVCKGTALPCNLDDFFNNFLADDAPHSMASFQTAEKGDTDFDTSDWAVSDDGFASSRTMSYIHPVNAPMAPPKAQARKRQKFRRFGEYGLCMETKTKIDDVPYSDCFFVEDRILVEPLPEGGVGLTALFEVRFVKNTMFRKIIENTTRGEYQGYWKGFIDMVKRELASGVGQEQKALPIVVPEVVVEQPKIETWLRWVVIGFVAFIALTQILLLYKVWSLQGSIILLEAALQTCQSTN